MSSEILKSQLFFKRLLSERVLNPNIYKDFKNKFSLNLDYDLTDEDIQYLTQIVAQTENLNSLNIRLSESLSDVISLNKLLRKISLKKQFTNLNFYIKYLNDDLFNEFLLFLTNINSSVNTLKIQIKYNEKQFNELKTKSILEHLLKNENNNINNIYFNECLFTSKDSIILLNNYVIKNKNKLNNLYIVNSLFYENNFNIDLSNLKIVELINSNLHQIKNLPSEKLNLNSNNISLDGIQLISDLLENSTLIKLNLSKNYLGDEGCSILAKGIKKNKSLIKINLSCNYIIDKGLVDIAMAMNSKSEDGVYNSSIKKINFDRNSINNSALIDFCNILKDEPENRFTKISMQYNYITDLSINNYGEFIQNFPEQTFLSLTNRISNTNQANFLNYCQGLTKIKTIIFENMSFQDNTSNLFNQILLNNKNIKDLFIYYNSILYPEDMSKISSGLEHNKYLSKIFLSQCQIGDEGAIILSNSLFNNINISQIFLDENKIGEKGVKEISEKLLPKISLKKLVLSHNLINSKGAYYISKALGEAQGIQFLFINSNKIGDEGSEFLSEGIEKNNSLIQLNLNRNEISNKGIKYVAKALLNKENFMSLSAGENNITDIENELYNLLGWCKEVVLSGNSLNKNGIIRLMQGSENNKLIKNLKFKANNNSEIFNFKCFNNNLKEFDLSYNYNISLSLVEKILSLKNISKLDLRSSNLGDSNISIITKHIKENNTPLKVLNIQSNLITSQGSEHIADMLKNNKYLKIINLAGNPLGYTGVNIICNALNMYPSILEELLLNYTKCNNYSSKNIYNMLVRNNKLKVLSLIGNYFHNKGIDIILSSLRLNKTLKVLSIGENKSKNYKGFQNIISYLGFNNSLTSLEMKSLKMEGKTLLKFGKILKDNKKLAYLNLIDNNLDYQNIIKFGLLIRKNNIINEVKMLLNKPNREEQACIKRCNPHIIFT